MSQQEQPNKRVPTKEQAPQSVPPPDVTAGLAKDIQKRVEALWQEIPIRARSHLLSKNMGVDPIILAARQLEAVLQSPAAPSAVTAGLRALIARWRECAEFERRASGDDYAGGLSDGFRGCADELAAALEGEGPPHKAEEEKDSGLLGSTAGDNS